MELLFLQIKYLVSKMAKIEYIVIHCTDSEWGSMSAIREWHLAKGWREVGYHLGILNGYIRPHIKGIQKELRIPLMDGMLEIGRMLDGDNYISPNEVGAHTLGYNGNSIGLVLVGKKVFTKKQFDTLANILPFLLDLTKLTKDRIKGHYEMTTGKTCPNFDVRRFVNERLK